MQLFIEAVAELLFGLAKNYPDEIPEISYKSEFVVKHSLKKTLARICAAFIIILIFSLLWLFIKDERYLFAIICSLGIIPLVLSLISISFKCLVTEICLKQLFFGMFKKTLKWNDVSCVRIIKKTDEKDVIIAIYNNDGKCVIDLSSDMENAWYVVKMAEYKNITVKQEKDLSLKKISYL